MHFDKYMRNIRVLVKEKTVQYIEHVKGDEEKLKLNKFRTHTFITHLNSDGNGDG